MTRRARIHLIDAAFIVWKCGSVIGSRAFWIQNAEPVVTVSMADKNSSHPSARDQHPPEGVTLWDVLIK